MDDEAVAVKSFGHSAAAYPMTAEPEYSNDPGMRSKMAEEPISLSCFNRLFAEHIA